MNVYVHIHTYMIVVLHVRLCSRLVKRARWRSCRCDRPGGRDKAECYAEPRVYASCDVTLTHRSSSMLPINFTMAYHLLKLAVAAPQIIDPSRTSDNARITSRILQKKKLLSRAVRYLS